MHFRKMVFMFLLCLQGFQYVGKVISLMHVIGNVA